MMIQSFHINIFAVLVVWILHIVMGLLWFQPKLFGNEWSRLTGKKLIPSEKWMIPGIVGHLLMATALALLIAWTNSDTWYSGLCVGLLAWIGFIVPMEIGELVWEKIPFKLFLIRIGNQCVGIAVSGIILGTWK
jgi:hypothetical protein